MTTPPPYESAQTEQSAQPSQNYTSQSYTAQPVAPRALLPTSMAHTNAYAIIAVILAFLQPIAGIVFGHMALGQIKRNGDSGRGLALTGLTIGYVYLGFLVIFIVFYVSMIALMIGSMGAIFSDMGNMGGSLDSLDSF